MKKIVYMLLLFMFASCDKADKNEPSTVDPNKWTLVEIQEPLMAVSTRGYNTISEDENVFNKSNMYEYYYNKSLIPLIKGLFESNYSNE